MSSGERNGSIWNVLRLLPILEKAPEGERLGHMSGRILLGFACDRILLSNQKVGQLILDQFWNYTYKSNL